MKVGFKNDATGLKALDLSHVPVSHEVRCNCKVDQENSPFNQCVFFEKPVHTDSFEAGHAAKIVTTGVSTLAESNAL